jgi:hypothetical protein
MFADAPRARSAGGSGLARGVVSGCGNGNYCPSASVSREQVAVFVAQGFGLALYGP